MNSIRTITEAKTALEKIQNLSQEVESFVASLEQRIDAVTALKGDMGQPDLPLKAQPVTKAPETWNERVLNIFQRANEPLRQKEVVTLYEALHWPSNYAHSLYATISGSIAYLHRKGKLMKTEDGYKISSQT